MRTQQQALVEFLGTSDTAFKIPVYQRVYSWNTAQCSDLWRDVIRAGELDSEHFIGTVLYSVERGSGRRMQYDIIDGQQRIATITIMLAAFADYLREFPSLSNLDLDPDLISRLYLYDHDNPEDAKMSLARADRGTLAALIHAKDLPDEPSERVIENYRLFREKMTSDAFDPQVFWRGICHLFAIVAELDDDDSPQLVFESLNSKGMPLMTGDLVRNMLLVGVSRTEQTRLYHEYWQPIEQALGEDPDGKRLNAAVHGWLAIRFPRAHIHDSDEVYDVFKSYVLDAYDGKLEDLLEELRGFCEMFASSTDGGIKDGAGTIDWAKGRARTRRGSFDELRGPEVTPLKRDLGSSRRTFT